MTPLIDSYNKLPRKVIQAVEERQPPMEWPATPFVVVIGTRPEDIGIMPITSVFQQPIWRELARHDRQVYYVDPDSKED